MISSHCTCSSKVHIDVDEVESNCYEQYSSLGCMKESSNSYSVRKFCEKLKKCLEDPQSYAQEEEKKNSFLNKFIENLDNFIEFLRDKSTGALMFVILLIVSKIY